MVIHDSAPFRQPSWYKRVYGTWHRAAIPRIARQARLVITPSEHVRAELIELFGLAADRVMAIAPGVDPAFAAPADPEPLRRRYGLERPYVLALGTEGPRKNLALIDRLAPELALNGLDAVIAGSTRPYLPQGSLGTVPCGDTGTVPCGDSPRARRLGYVADEDLPALYAGAAAFAMPSLYEGFGLPCIEAMAAGTPVVAANRAALPEACDGAALLADPDDLDAFAAALLRAAGAERDDLVAKGRRRAAALSWERTAELLDRALEPLLATRRRP